LHKSFKSSNSQIINIKLSSEKEEEKNKKVENNYDDSFKCPFKHIKEDNSDYIKFQLEINHGVELFNSTEKITSDYIKIPLLSPSTIKAELLRIAKTLEEERLFICYTTWRDNKCDEYCFCREGTGSCVNGYCVLGAEGDTNNNNNNNNTDSEKYKQQSVDNKDDKKNDNKDDKKDETKDEKKDDKKDEKKDDTKNDKKDDKKDDTKNDKKDDTKNDKKDDKKNDTPEDKKDDKNEDKKDDKKNDTPEDKKNDTTDNTIGNTIDNTSSENNQQTTDGNNISTIGNTENTGNAGNDTPANESSAYTIKKGFSILIAIVVLVYFL